MIAFLKSWANQIIVAVIIATIFEMLLPNGNNKKYIKMIIGLYVLFTVIQPIITKVTGNNIEISDFNYKKYFDEDTVEASSKDFEDNNSKLIEQAYIDNIKNDIKTKINQKGYEVISCSVNIMNSKKDEYGAIENINLKVKKIKEEESEKETSNTIKVENVDINISNSNTNNKQEKSSISENEKTEIIEYLANEYSINRKNIVIN